MLEEASALLDQAKSLFEDREKQLEKGEAELKRQIEVFEQEKKLMTTVAVADNDVLNLNTGGTLLATKRSTLTQAEGSALAARFSGRWEECLDHDDQGRIFLDFDPYCFQQILFYLRSRSNLSSAEATAALPEVEAGKEHAYRDLVKYLALEEYMGYSGGICSLFVEAGWGVQITAEGQRAKGTLPDERVGTPSSMPLDISAASQRKYVFMVILYDTGDEVELLPVTAEDKQLLP